jgi:aspartate 1-decarboxylase
MRRRMLKSKIHRATVTSTDIDYVGSVSIDAELMSHADIREWEQVAVLDIDNGARFETYAIPGEPGQIQLNGAAARLVDPGHLVILLTYADYEEFEIEEHAPTVVRVDDQNRPLDPGGPHLHSVSQ